jgi:glycosyltransferase involved in cell wall biosynthesis
MWKVLGLHPRLIHAHDLQAYRFVAYPAATRSVPLVYDSHELERGRNAPSWGPMRRGLHALSERATIGRASAVITVAPSIADLLAEAYGIERPLVLVNSHSRGHIRENRPLGERLGLPSGHRVVLYLGALTGGRGLRHLLKALQALPANVHLALFGSVRPEWDAEWRALLASIPDARDRIHYQGSVPYEDVIHEAWGADVGFNGIELDCESYEHALPNKLFEYAFAKVPILSTRSHSADTLIRKYALGRLYEDGDARALLEALRSMTSSRVRVPADRRERFINDYCWESQSAALLTLYQQIIGKPS